MRMFGRPEGLLGRLGGVILARVNRPFAREVIALLEVRASDKVLEVGFGPGVGIELLAEAAPMGTIAGIDPSKEMVEQAARRNAAAIRTGAVVLRHGTVEAMPFADAAFDHVADAQFFSDLPDIDGPTLVSEGGTAGDHHQVREARERRDDVFGYPVTQIAEVLARAEIIERKHGDGGNS